MESNRKQVAAPALYGLDRVISFLIISISPFVPRKGVTFEYEVLE